MQEPLFNMLQQKGLLLIVIDESQMEHLTLNQVRTWIPGSKALSEIESMEVETPPVTATIGTRTDRQILEQTNELALRILGANGMEQTPENVEKWVCNIHHPTARAAWNTACVAQQIITETDPNDCLYVLDEDGADADQ